MKDNDRTVEQIEEDKEFRMMTQCWVGTYEFSWGQHLKRYKVWWKEYKQKRKKPIFHFNSIIKLAVLHI